MALSKVEQEEIEAALEIIGFREFITPSQFQLLSDRFSKISFEKGDSVLLQGRSGGAFFILLIGTVTVWGTKGGTEKVQLANIRPVTYFGEIALLERSERIATIIAEDHVEVFVLGKKDFFELFYSIPQIKNKIDRQALERKQDTDSKMHIPLEPVAVEPRPVQGRSFLIKDRIARIQERIIVGRLPDITEEKEDLDMAVCKPKKAADTKKPAAKKPAAKKPAAKKKK